ncbi:MAG: polyprenyl synthetase family protein, partial [Symbiobacteriaceae bacterium]|nr:polyprenyl synthetase family protein [Symbiobacteriaceae bacterium]
FDEATAVLAGDALLSEAFPIIIKGIQLEAYDATVAVKIINEMAKAAGAGGMVGGQSGEFDLAADLSKPPCNEVRQVDLLARIMDIYSGKTGALLRCAFSAAAEIAGLCEEERILLHAVGTQFGFVFQIQDDLLDSCGDPKIMGKATGRDKRRGKMNYPTLIGLEATHLLLAEEDQKLAALMGRLSLDRPLLIEYITGMRDRER